MPKKVPDYLTPPKGAGEDWVTLPIPRNTGIFGRTEPEEEPQPVQPIQSQSHQPWFAVMIVVCFLTVVGVSFVLFRSTTGKPPVAKTVVTVPTVKAEEKKEVKVAKADVAAPKVEDAPVPKKEEIKAPKKAEIVPIPRVEAPLVVVPIPKVMEVITLTQIKLPLGSKILKTKKGDLIPEMDPQWHVYVQTGPNQKKIIRLALSEKGVQYFAVDKDGKLVICQRGNKAPQTVSMSTSRPTSITIGGKIQRGSFYQIPTDDVVELAAPESDQFFELFPTGKAGLPIRKGGDRPLVEIKLPLGSQFLDEKKMLLPPMSPQVHVYVQLGPDESKVVRLALSEKTGQYFAVAGNGNLVICQPGRLVPQDVSMTTSCPTSLEVKGSVQRGSIYVLPTGIPPVEFGVPETDRFFEPPFFAKKKD